MFPNQYLSGVDSADMHFQGWSSHKDTGRSCLSEKLNINPGYVIDSEACYACFFLIQVKVFNPFVWSDVVNVLKVNFFTNTRTVKIWWHLKVTLKSVRHRVWRIYFTMKVTLLIPLQKKTPLRQYLSSCLVCCVSYTRYYTIVVFVCKQWCSFRNIIIIIGW